MRLRGLGTGSLLCGCSAAAGCCRTSSYWDRGPANSRRNAATATERPQPRLEADRQSIGRIFAMNSVGTFDADDKAYLAQIVSAHTGLPSEEASKRVDTVVAQAREAAEKAREIWHRHRLPLRSLYVGQRTRRVVVSNGWRPSSRRESGLQPRFRFATLPSGQATLTLSQAPARQRLRNPHPCRPFPTHAESMESGASGSGSRREVARLPTR